MKRTTQRRGRLLAVLAALALPAAAITAPIAFANTTPPSPAIIIDGVLNETGTQPLDDPQGNVKELGPKNSNTTKIGVIHSAPLPMLDTTNPNGQVDLQDAAIKAVKDSSGDDWFYFSWHRDSSTGSGFIAIEVMKNAAPSACAYDTATTAQLIADCNPWKNRKGDPQPGDFMILWDQQGGSKDLFLRTWTGTAPNLTLSAGVQLNSSVSAAEYTPDGFGGEAAINLTDAVFGGVQACRSFANIIPSTVTGNSDSADYKDTILQPTVPIGGCESTTVTTPKVVTDTSTNPGTIAAVPAGGASIGTGVLAVADEAVVDIQGGVASPAGSVAFYLCKLDSPALCTSGGTSVGSTTVTGASYPVTVQSPTAYVTSAGRYCWRAEYSGDSATGIGGSSDSRVSECFTVNPVDPTLSTSAGNDVVIGSAVIDSATLGGTATQPANPVINLTGTSGAAAGGTITFKLYGPSDTGCGSLVYTSGAVTVNGNGTYNSPTPQFVPTETGDYHWVAVYSGNSPNTNGLTHNAACTDTDEDVVVGPDTPTIATQATATAVLGTSISDTATISDGYFPVSGGPAVGTVTFKLYGPFGSGDTISANSCVDPDPGNNIAGNLLFTSGPINASRVDNTTASATSGSYEPTAPGKYAWVASYSGNANNNAVSGTCGDLNEASLITKAPASLTTAQTLRPQDSVTVAATAGGTPTGTVTFKLFGPNNLTCTPGGAAPVYSEVGVALNAGSAATNNTTFEVNASTAGSYKWLVSYSGDDNHLPIAGTCGAENFTLAIDNGGTVTSP